MNSSFEYIGDVKIKVSRKSYKYKNSGTNLLFTYFCQWLAGENLQNDIKPYQLEVIDINEHRLTYQPTPVITEYRTTNQGPATVVTAVILDSNINITTIAENGDYYLSLQNSNGDELARIKIETAVLTQVQTGRQALVEWTMRISNREVVTNG